MTPCLFVAASLAIAIGLLRLRERARLRAAERELQLLASSVTPFAPGPCTLRGVLRGGPAVTVTTADEQRHYGPDLWLEWEGSRIEIAGDLIVAAGTTEHNDRRMTLRALREGDEIIVHGTVRFERRRWTIAGATALALVGTPTGWYAAAA